MSAIHEVCSCGAKFDYRSNDTSIPDAQCRKAAKEWRDQHHHNPPPVPPRAVRGAVMIDHERRGRWVRALQDWDESPDADDPDTNIVDLADACMAVADAESAERIQVKSRLMEERDTALAEVERLKAEEIETGTLVADLQQGLVAALAANEHLRVENADLRRGRITATPHTWADTQTEPGQS